MVYKESSQWQSHRFFKIFVKIKFPSVVKEWQSQMTHYSEILEKTTLICGKIQGLYFFKVQSVAKLVRIRRSFAQMCCLMSLVCPWIATHCTCEFWARSEPVNMPKTIESPVNCGVHAVIRFLYSEQATRNVVLRYCPSSWQCSAAYYSCNKQAPEAFLMERVWSTTIICLDLAPSNFHLFPCMKRS